METICCRVTDAYGHYIMDLDIPWEDFYWIKKTFVCEVQPFQLILY